MLTGDNGRGDLSAREDAEVTVLEFGAALGIVREGENGVRGVEADADKVNLRHFRHPFTLNEREGEVSPVTVYLSRQ